MHPAASEIIFHGSRDELFVISLQCLPSGEDIHIDNETGAFVMHDSVHWWLKLLQPTDVKYRTKDSTDLSLEQTKCGERGQRAGV